MKANFTKAHTRILQIVEKNHGAVILVCVYKGLIKALIILINLLHIHVVNTDCGHAITKLQWFHFNFYQEYLYYILRE